MTDLSTKFEDLDQLWNPADIPGSEVAFRTLLEDTQKLATPDHSHLVELLALLARSEALQQKFQAARSSLEKAERLLKQEQPTQATSIWISMKIRWLIEKGRLQVLEKTPSQARTYFSEAWTLAINSGENYFAVEIAQLMAVTEPQKSQQEWLIRGIEIAEKSSHQKTKMLLGPLYSSLGWKFYDLKLLEKSLATFQKALKHHTSFGTGREAFVAQWSIGKVLRALGKVEEALAIQKALLSELGIGGERDGRLYEEVAECLQALRRTTEAQPYFELAYRELSNDEWVTDNQPVKLKRMKDLGKAK